MSSPSNTAALEVVLFDIGAYCIACPSDQVAAMLATPPRDTWICLETLLGVEPKQCKHQQRHYLEIYCPQGTTTIALPSAPRMATLDAACVHALPLLLRQHNHLPALVALGFLPDVDSSGHHCVLIFDFRRL
ncbi:MULTISPECIES: hypothetical protein [Giesbergeria]|uniref:Uncharacterized protein n=1 Tax=Giesbergeria sinuosa TaxID=80883 RepID=A0ABV9QBG8_9BURK